MNAFLTTADGRLLLHTVLATLAYIKALPAEDEVSKISTDEDTDDDVPVVVHGEQHDEVSYGKLKHV